MHLYVVMVEYKGSRWFLRKSGRGATSKFTITSSLGAAFNFRTIPSADKQRDNWTRKYPNTDTFRVGYSEDKPKLYTLDGEPVEINDG